MFVLSMISQITQQRFRLDSMASPTRHVPTCRCTRVEHFVRADRYTILRVDLDPCAAATQFSAAC